MLTRWWLRNLWQSLVLQSRYGHRSQLKTRRRRSQQTIESLDSRLLLSTLGTASIVEGPSAGKDSVTVLATGAWTASTTASWITVNTTSGTGNGAVNFSFTADAGATRSGTVTIAGQTLTVTQAGVGYVAAGPTTLTSGLYPGGVAVDGSGDVYVADTYNDAIKGWNAATGTVTTLVATGLYQPNRVAVDGSGNVYIADTGNNAIKEWNAATGKVARLVYTGLLSRPESVAVDVSGNVYPIGGNNNNNIKELPRAYDSRDAAFFRFAAWSSR